MHGDREREHPARAGRAPPEQREPEDVRRERAHEQREKERSRALLGEAAVPRHERRPVPPRERARDRDEAERHAAGDERRTRGHGWSGWAGLDGGPLASSSDDFLPDGVSSPSAGASGSAGAGAT